MPILIPSRFASIEGARIKALGVVYAAITIGLPRKSGFACCSIVAKQELRSICMMRGLLRLINGSASFNSNFFILGVSVRYLFKNPAQGIRIMFESEC